MPTGGPEIVVELEPYRPGGLWLVCYLSVGEDASFPVVFSPGLPHSYIGPVFLNDLLVRSAPPAILLAEPVRPGAYLISSAKLARTSVPNFEVQLSPVANLLD